MAELLFVVLELFSLILVFFAETVAPIFLKGSSIVEFNESGLIVTAKNITGENTFSVLLNTYEVVLDCKDQTENRVSFDPTETTISNVRISDVELIIWNGSIDFQWFENNLEYAHLIMETELETGVTENVVLANFTSERENPFQLLFELRCQATTSVRARLSVRLCVCLSA